VTNLSVSEVIREVRALAARPVEGPVDLAQWYLASAKLQRSILASNLWDEMPHFVAHYLSDADLRAKSPEYRANQERELEQALSQWQERAA
jgi:hypothetical protein